MASSGGVGGVGGGGVGGALGLVTAPMPHPLPDIIDYKVKLLGLLPDGYMYLGGSRRWDLSTACFIKIPSEMTCYEGKIDRKGHPTLIGSGILERKYGLTVQLPTLAESERAASAARESVKEQEEGEDEEDNGDGHHDVICGLGSKIPDDDVILEEEEDEGDESGNESGSEGSEGDKRNAGSRIELGVGGSAPNFICQGCQHNATQNQKDNLMTKWLKNNFDPRRDVLPDIVCRRTVLTYIMTQKQPFILNAKKISFTSSQDPERKEHKVIHVEFDYLPTMDFDPHPPGSGGPGSTGPGSAPGDRSSRGPSGSSKTPDGLPTSEKNFDAESYYDKPNLIGYFAGKLSCKVPTMPPENRSIRLLLSAIVDGLWRHKNEPELYAAQDLAEVKSTMDTTVVSDPKKGGSPHFFKQVRMAHAWAQCHLVGINRMMVGVHTLVPGNFTEEEDEPAYALTSRPKRILQELWLYDVDKMPTAVKISSDEDGFKPWTPTDLKWKLYTALQQIRAQVQNSDEGVTHRFLHYFNEDFLVPMTLEELQQEWKAIHEAYRTLVFRNVHIVQTSPDVIELSMEEVEQEHAEKQVDLILNSFLGLGIPVETIKVVRIMGIRKELEVIFPYEGLARRVYSTFRLFCLRNRFLPRGFEKIRVDVKRTKRQELERMRRKGAGNLFYLIQNPTPNYNLSGVHHNEQRYQSHHHQSHHQQMSSQCHQCCHRSGGAGDHSYGPYGTHSHQRSTAPSPFPPNNSGGGRHHSHSHHHHTGGKHHHGSSHNTATLTLGSTTNVPGIGLVYGRTCPRVPRDEEDPWRYTQTMWR